MTLVPANLLSISGIDYHSLMKYMTIFWILCCAIIPFAIGKRLGLSQNTSFLISFISISAFWVIQNYYSPQMLGYIIYLLIFMLVITFKSRMAEYISITLLFGALVLTHGLTTIAVMLAILALALLQKNEAVYLVVFGYFYILVSVSCSSCFQSRNKNVLEWIN